jgi:serine/threonine protein phosphatase PrpC
MKVFTWTERGGHAKNEDYVNVVRLPKERHAFVCAVADGQGGRAGGGRASELACESALLSASAFPIAELQRPQTWKVPFMVADHAVLNEPSAGFTTLVAFLVSESMVCGASSGDSAVVLLTANEPPRILTAEQLKNPAVGSGNAIATPFSARLSSPWTLIAMTDGVWKYAGIERVLGMPLEKSGEAIRDSLRERAALKETDELQDDFSLIVCRG